MQRKNLKKAKSRQLKAKSSYKIGIIVSSYNSDVTFPMRDAAVQTLKNIGVKEKNIFVIEAPGSFEIPLLCQKMIQAKPSGRPNPKAQGQRARKLDGVIAVGCVIKGDTDHYYFISQESTRGVMDVMLKTGVPIANAILTVNNLEQAKLRSKGEMNKGIEAAEALMQVLATI